MSCALNRIKPKRAEPLIRISPNKRMLFTEKVLSIRFLYALMNFLRQAIVFLLYCYHIGEHFVFFRRVAQKRRGVVNRANIE